MKEFTSAVEQAERDEDEGIPFLLDDRECRAYMPTDSQVAMAIAGVGRHTSDMQKMAAAIDFFVGVLDKNSEQYVVDRMMSRENPLGLDKVEEIVMWLIEEFTGRPTRSPSASTRSQRSGGPKSKPRTTKSTSSRPVPASSAT